VEVITIVLAVYAAIMTYLKLTASKTKNTVDDKLLEVGEKVEPVVDMIKDKVIKK